MSHPKARNADTATAKETESITLAKPHVHRGISCVPDDALLVTPNQAKSLKARKVAK